VDWALCTVAWHCGSLSWDVGFLRFERTLYSYWPIIVLIGSALILASVAMRHEYLTIYGTGRKIKLEGNRGVLEKLIVEVRNQLV